MKNRLIINCACQNPDHLLVFDYYEDENAFWDDVSVSFTSKYYENFWKRLRIGLRYIFRGKTFITGDSVMFTYSNIEEMEKMVDYLKKRVQDEADKCLSI